ncbi:unnamed protein product [Cochlearia groenlandica]
MTRGMAEIGETGTTVSRQGISSKFATNPKMLITGTEATIQKIVVSTENVVKTAFGKVGKEGVVIDMDKLNQTRSGEEESRSTTPMTGEIPAKMTTPTKIPETSATMPIRQLAGKPATTARSG